MRPAVQALAETLIATDGHDEGHMSRSQTARLFGASVGMGPMTYLRELRVQRMAQLLRFSNLSVTGRPVGPRARP